MTLSFTPAVPHRLGQSVQAHATAPATLAGTIEYTWWNGPGCTGTAMSAGGGLVVAGLAPPSSSIQMTSQGVKSFKAATDLLGVGDTSPCTEITIVKAQPDMTVIPPAGTVTAGQTPTTTSSMAGGFNATGSITYSIYLASNCTGSPITTTGPIPIVTPGTMPGSGPMLINRAGAGTATSVNLYWQVSYPGDSNNEPDPSSCVTKAVARAATTTSLTMAPTTVTTGLGTTGTSIFAGGVNSPGGQVVFTAYQNSTCTTLFSPTVANSKPVTGNATYISTPISIPLVGSRYVRARYGGDDNNATSQSPCRLVTVNISAPTLNLLITPAQVTLGGTASAVGTLVNASTAATGTVTYRVYSNATCATEVAGKSSTATVTAGSVSATTSPTSIPFATAGSFFWRGVYGGDANNGTATSSCVPFNVLVSPSISAAYSPSSIAVGGSSVATSTLTGATATAGGTVTYAVFSNSGCTTGLTSGINGAKTVANAVVPNSNSGTFNTGGTFYVKATYSGDTLNNTATSGCASLTVAKLTPVLTMSQSPNPVAIGGSFGYGFSLTGTTGAATGTVTLQLYTSNTCGTPISGQSHAMTVAGSAVPNSPSIPYVFPGTVYARASYGGDANHNTSTTPCAAVGLATGSMSASLSNATFNPLPYSNNAQVNSGQLVLTVTDPRGTAAGWSVSIVAGPFVYSGTAIGQSSIPAANFALTATGAPTTVSGQPIGAGGPTATGATGALSTSRTIVVASTGFGSGTYNQIVNVNLTIPGTSKAGTYTSTMTVTTAAAP
jgi:hypothetical protein